MSAVSDATPAVLTEPGIYDIPEHLYHADPVPGGSLSSSGARKLLPPSCPAKFRYEREHPPAASPDMELGTAAHKLVLGVGQEIAVIARKDWRSGAARDEADAAREDGKLPLLTHQHEQVRAMAAAITAHPAAGRLFDPWRGGSPEQSLFCPDKDTGVWCRARLDWMPDPGSRRPVICDYKTAKSANPDTFARSAADFGYHIQQAFYQMTWQAITGTDAGFVFVVQEKEPPYLVTVCQLDDDSVRAGRLLTRRALEIYRDCTEAGVWPAFTDDIAYISLPYWAIRRAEEN